MQRTMKCTNINLIYLNVFWANLFIPNVPRKRIMIVCGIQPFLPRFEI